MHSFWPCVSFFSFLFHFFLPFFCINILVSYAASGPSLFAAEAAGGWIKLICAWVNSQHCLQLICWHVLDYWMTSWKAVLIMMPTNLIMPPERFVLHACGIIVLQAWHWLHFLVSLSQASDAGSEPLFAATPNAKNSEYCFKFLSKQTQCGLHIEYNIAFKLAYHDSSLYFIYHILAQNRWLQPWGYLMKAAALSIIHSFATFKFFS